MITRQIPIKRDVRVEAVNITDNNEIPGALRQLNIPNPSSVIVLVGGADGISWLDKFAMRKAIGIIARLAEETQAVVVDGGTQAGIMTEIGKQRKQNKFSFPRSEEHTSELQSLAYLVCRLLLEKKKINHFILQITVTNSRR